MGRTQTSAADRGQGRGKRDHVGRKVGTRRQRCGKDERERNRDSQVRAMERGWIMDAQRDRLIDLLSVGHASC